jgi:LysR family transcriptional regulator, regulator for bpeEF and oprC
MDKLQAMEVFVQVVDAGGFTRAADNLKLPKATVSTLVRNLETALSVKLLNRTTRQISLTADGAAYYERCMRILAEVRDAEDSLSKTHASPSGRLRIDVPAALGRHVLMPSLPQFLARYPDIHLEVGCSDRPVDLIEENVDLAVRGGTLADSTLIARRIGLLHFVTCAAPSYIALHGRPLHPTDLARHQCVNYFSAKTGKISEWDFARDGERIQMRVPGRIAVNDSNAYMTATLSGMGVAQMAAFVICPYLQTGELELLLEDWTIDPLPLHVVYPQNRHLSAKVRVFVEWISELFADHPALHIRAGRCPLTDEGLAASVAEQAVQKASEAPLVEARPVPG